MNTRADRKAVNRAEAAILFAKLQRQGRTAEYELALARLRNDGQDKRIALDLGINVGPGLAAMRRALLRSETEGRKASFGGCAPDSASAFLAIAYRAILQWRKQAGAIERGIRNGSLAVRDGMLVRYRGESARVLGFANVYALVQLCAVIEENLSKPRAVRIEFVGKVNPQVVQSVTARAPGGVCDVAQVTEFVPWVRAKVRQYHEHERGNSVEVSLRPARTFALRLCA